MAGESPDKSEQRKSSGETTPGERDPRLAVFRESAARPNQDDGAALDAGHVDQPTAIFKMPTKTPPEEPTKPSAAPEGDARLRAAVAAWVATSDDDTPDADESGAASADAASDDAAAGTDSDADADASAADGAAADGDEPSADESAPDAGADARSDELSPDTDTPDESDAQASGAEDVRSGAGDDAPSSADSAAPVSQSGVDVSGAKDGRAASEPDASDADAVPASEDGSGDGATAGAAAGSRADADVSGADAESESEGGSGSGAEAGASAARAEGGRVAAGRGESAADDDAPRAGGAPGGSGARAQEDAKVSGADAVPASEGGSGGGAIGGPAADAQADAEASEAEDGSGRTALGGDAEAESASEGGSGGGAIGGPAADAQADVEVSEAEDGSGRTGEAESAADGGSGGGAAGGQGDAGGAGGGVDQATAVFKAVRPRAAIDQPTTALKSVGPPKAPKPAPKPAPESAAERTSKFVPLIKPDDVRPPARKPQSPQSPQGAGKPAAPAPASGALPEAERTRQQPLPPLPPLDLLAELTNTPPPPETPVRNALRRVKIWTPLVLLLVIVFAVVQFLRPLPAPVLALTAKATYTFEGGALDMPWPEEGQSAVEVQGVGSIGTHGAQKSAPIASVTKAMTAYVILKEHPLKGDDNGPKITVDEQAEKESKAADESTAAIKEGQEFTERQMLQLLMIPSGNNAARLLARWDADSEAEFVKKMNDAAKDLGMKNTTYTDPSGLDATTVSTATDQLKLAKAVMENDVFQEIVNTPEIEIPGIDGKIYNNNKILLEPGVSGVKTGSSTPAGGNLLWSADTIVDGKKRRIVGAVMGQQTGTTLDSKLQLAITNSLKLIQAAQRDVTSATVVKKGDVVGYVDDGLGGQTPVVATKNLNAVGWPGLKVELAISDSGKPLPHAAKAGTEVGQVTIGTGPGQVKAPVALQKDLVEPGFSEKLARVG